MSDAEKRLKSPIKPGPAVLSQSFPSVSVDSRVGHSPEKLRLCGSCGFEDLCWSQSGVPAEADRLTSPGASPQSPQRTTQGHRIRRPQVFPVPVGKQKRVNVLVIGGAGMIGARLIEQLASDPQLNGTPVDRITAFDVVSAQRPAGVPDGIAFDAIVGDLSDPATCRSLVAPRPDIIFHLAAIVSGEAEADFAKGYRINLDGTRHLLQAITEQADYCPKVVFTSSIAVFGAPFPEAIGDDFHNTPLTSYGTQKAIGELLLSDFSRRGLLDGIGIRLPTICVRPGQPNKAASGFFSNIIREPLAGQPAVLPVATSVRHWHASPRAAVSFLTHAASLDLTRLGARRNLTMPGLSVTVQEQLDALRKIAGAAVVDRIEHREDPDISRMVAGWPRNFRADRALALGFQADDSFEAIIRQHIDQELGGHIA